MWALPVLVANSLAESCFADELPECAFLWAFNLESTRVRVVLVGLSLLLYVVALVGGARRVLGGWNGDHLGGSAEARPHA